MKTVKRILATAGKCVATAAFMLLIMFSGNIFETLAAQEAIQEIWAN